MPLRGNGTRARCPRQSPIIALFPTPILGTPLAMLCTGKENSEGRGSYVSVPQQNFGTGATASGEERNPAPAPTVGVPRLVRIGKAQTASVFSIRFIVRVHGRVAYV